MAKSTRERLLGAAAAAVAEEGLGVAMDAVAERAGVSRMTLYRHFGSRDSLLLAVLQRRAGEASGRLAAILGDRRRPFPDRLVDAVVAIVEEATADPVLRLFVERVTPRQVEELDPGGSFVGGVWDFLLPFFEDPENRRQLRHDPERTLDWTLRQTLLQLMVRARTWQTIDELRAELHDFFVPAVAADAVPSPAC